ncbi:MAG: bifunctional (p)ppGpp synthetase/guanosine-3',5'-bis(diphosphate) 3'-pyrophosphohydrolase [Rhodobacteraceae bacterium]|nr:bifunctional (p)ppGpp synthetase/guanosine-3',5'-bis(diphosphate) 3'-pyrophosphohydrolase [Paracoccaceae bacterium]
MCEIVKRAEHFARIAHSGQTRKGPRREPYVTHLEEVAEFVRRHGGDDVAIAAAWLHDTLEDCRAVTPLAIAEVFGPAIAGVVGELTDDKTLPKKRRKVLQVLNAPLKSRAAALVKLGDKASNVRAVGASRPVDWSHARCHDYVDWAEKVADGLPWPLPGARAELAARIAATRAELGPR